MLLQDLLRKPGGLGAHTLDQALGLTAGGFSFSVMETAARRSTSLA